FKLGVDLSASIFDNTVQFHEGSVTECFGNVCVCLAHHSAFLCRIKTCEFSAETICSLRSSLATAKYRVKLLLISLKVMNGSLLLAHSEISPELCGSFHRASFAFMTECDSERNFIRQRIGRRWILRCGKAYE